MRGTATEFFRDLISATHERTNDDDATLSGLEPGLWVGGWEVCTRRNLRG